MQFLRCVHTQVASSKTQNIPTEAERAMMSSGFLLDVLHYLGKGRLIKSLSLKLHIQQAGLN